MANEFKTVLEYARIEYEDKKSRFITSVKPVKTEKEALDFLGTVRSEFWDASHNVYAYYIAGEITAQRFSDDGEPSGTAGMPVLEALKRSGVQDVIVVVTRYFGGTLLGAAGLIRAYGRSAMLGIERSVIVNEKMCIETHASVEYSLSGRIQSFLIESGQVIEEIEYKEDVTFNILVGVGEAERLKAELIDTANGRISFNDVGRRSILVTLDGKYIKCEQRSK